MEALYGCFRMGRCLHLTVMAATAETLLRTGRCLLRMVTAATAETLCMGRCLHRMVMAATAETCVWFNSPFRANGYSGLPAVIREVGVWP